MNNSSHIHLPKAAFLIGAATSNSGKTTLTIGLLRALKKRGFCLQPFKCGPDYIDPQYHMFASGQHSVNLDTWLSSSEHVSKLYSYYSEKAEISIIEGVMGLFDGYKQSLGSSAEIARLLNVPVILVVNAKSTAYSVAPLIYGFKHFDKRIHIAGVIFNQIGSSHHAEFLKQACEDAQVTYLGYLPYRKELELPSRHLGLTLDARYELDAFSSHIAQIIEEYVNIDLLLDICQVKSSSSNNISESDALYNNLINYTLPFPIKRIAIARDAAFNFTYYHNLKRLAEVAELCYFSPIADSCLPQADFVYLPGGYPEFFLQELTSNHSMRQSIQNYIENGGYLLAECGGMMYLCRDIYGMDGKWYPMVGALPLRATMQNMRLHLGYRTLTHEHLRFRGHEFHYSDILKDREDIPTIGQQSNAKGVPVSTALYRYKNAIAGYTHWYWGECNPFDLFIEKE